VENFLLFRDETVLTMIASSDDRHPEHLMQAPGASRRVLRSAGIYGANGHGKTRLVEAIAFLKDIVLKGTDEGKRIPIETFRPDRKYRNRPSRFTIDFIVDGTHYEYGIVLDRDYIHEEWLFGRPKKKEVLFFERSTQKTKNPDGYKTKFEFGPHLKKIVAKQTGKPEYIEFVGDGTRHNQPFLAEAVQRNVAALTPIRRWFRSNLVIVETSSQYAALHIRAQRDSEFVEFISNFMSRADIGIDHFEVIETKLDRDKLKDLPSELQAALEGCEDDEVVNVDDPEGATIAFRKDENGDIVSLSLKSVHKMDDGTPVSYNMEEESAGTRRLINLLPMLIDLVGTTRTYVVDELDRKLHPLLSYRFIESFLAKPGKGQLIFTTHNSHLLDQKLFRRDELWFVGKSKDGAGTLYSLSDFKARTDLNIEKGYLQGRFGGIPIDGHFSEVDWKSDQSDSPSRNDAH
jgi:AAA15 family ATPase/GTPase